MRVARRQLDKDGMSDAMELRTAKDGYPDMTVSMVYGGASNWLFSYCGWLSVRKLAALVSAVPENICIAILGLQPSFWVNKWEYYKFNFVSHLYLVLQCNTTGVS